MRKRLLFTGIAMALLALTVSPALALAQTQQSSAETAPAIKDGLAIVAPRAAAVGREVSITVFKCSDQTPIEGAGIWVVARDKIEAVKEDLTNLKADKDAAQQEQTLDVHGTLIGRTDSSGRILHAFNDAGRYLLVTDKSGYWPDARIITVGVKPVALPGLAIDAPRRADVGETVTITVTEKPTGNSVKDAGVWALTWEKAEALKAEAGARNTDRAQFEAAVENSLDVNGTFLGRTNGAGKIMHSFDDAGKCLLVTFKRGYVPAYRPIIIGGIAKVLAIEAPNKAGVNENVAITVTEKGTGGAVKEAKVWSLTRAQGESLRAEVSNLMQNNDPAAIENTIATHGTFLGTTNGAGMLNHKFQNAGGYLLLAYKAGYWPAFRPIVIANDMRESGSSQVVPGAGSSSANLAAAR